MDLKEEFVIQARKETISFSAICSEYGISRKTGCKWLSRFTEDGLTGLEDHSTRPKTSPDHLNEDTVCRLIRIKQDHIYWDPKKIHAICLGGATEPNSLSSVKRILAKSGYTEKRKRRRRSKM